MTYRQSTAPGVRLRVRRRERVPPLYGPPTWMQHQFQEAARTCWRQTMALYAKTNAWIAASERSSDVKILLPDECSATLRIRMKS